MWSVNAYIQFRYRPSYEQFFNVYYVSVFMQCIYEALLTEILILLPVSVWTFAGLVNINDTDRFFVHLYICV
jgi:hypothetical protein